jgi:hypothetical protein
MGGKMAIKIICLANSKKFNERCVAGIEVGESSAGYKIIFSNSKPKWLRPVSKTEHGEFPAMIAQNIALLDVVEFNLVAHCPSGYQTENVYFAENSVKKVSSVKLASTNLDKLTCNTNTLFGNKGKALVFIKVHRYNVFIKPENNQLRMNFDHNSVEYDLPVTDIKFETIYRNNNRILDRIRHLYLTISLAVVHNHWHSKLIAGVIYI